MGRKRETVTLYIRGEFYSPEIDDERHKKTGSESFGCSFFRRLASIFFSTPGSPNEIAAFPPRSFQFVSQKASAIRHRLQFLHEISGRLTSGYETPKRTAWMPEG